MRFPEFEEKWELRKFGEIVTNKSKKYNPSNATNSIKCIELEHIVGDSGQLLGFIDGSQSGSIKNVFEKGDVLFGKLRPYLRKYLHAPFDGVCSSEIWVLQGIDISNDFLYRIIQTDRFIDLANQSSGSKMPRADWNIIENSRFFIPSRKEQHKISTLLSLVDLRIRTQSKIIQRLESSMQGLTENLFKRKIRFKNENGDDFPDWEIKKLGEVCEEHQLKNSKKKNNEVFSVAKHKGVINQIEHLGRSFSAKNIAHYKLIFPGDLVYTKSPTSDFLFGIIKQNRTGRIGVVSPLYCVFSPKTFSLGYLIHEYFRSSVNTYNYLNPLVQKGAKNTMNINNNDFLNGAGLVLPFCEKEQARIANFLSSITQRIETEKAILDQLEKQKKYLLQQMFI